MALERLSLAPVVLGGGGDDELNKAPRLPRWTRQELLVLIQGKRVAENRVRRGRSAVLEFGSSSQVEPKWSSVSSYCKRHGVNRGPVQCRKRWSNLAGDFRKIKEWESQVETESFWAMRNDLRRERKLPGFFDKEVYDILDGDGTAAVGGGDKSLVLSLAPSSKVEVLFDSGRSAAADDGLFSDADVDANTNANASPIDKEEAAPTPISVAKDRDDASASPTAVAKDRNDASPTATTGSPPDPEASRTRKRKRVEEEMIEAMERNGRLLEIQNTNSRLDREQRQQHATTLFQLLNKLADAMVTIADKL